MEISVNQPQMPEGTIIAVGKWAIPNGGSIEVPDEEVNAFLETKPNFGKNSSTVTFHGNVIRPTPPVEPLEEQQAPQVENDNNPLNELTGGGEHD